MLVDAHFHIWRQADLPWLQGPMQPRIFGPYEAIRRDYMMAEYLADCTGEGVAQSVYVQANWPPERFEDEVAWVSQVAEEHGSPHAITAYADFLADDVRPQLDRLSRYPLVRAVRMQLHWHERQDYRFAAGPEVLGDPRLAANLAHLAERGLPFELQIFPGQVSAAVALAERVPQLPFILVHGGMLEDRTEPHLSPWRDAVARLAALPHMHVKLSGLGTFVRSLSPDLIGIVTRELVHAFGADRCLFGSNFPIEKLWTDYRSLLAAHRAAAAHLTLAEQQALFGGTAQRLYRLEARI